MQNQIVEKWSNEKSIEVCYIKKKKYFYRNNSQLIDLYYEFRKRSKIKSITTYAR
jgi:hypothetical protein